MSQPLIVGSQDPCPHCGAAAVASESEDKNFVWWHRRTDCCDKAKWRRGGFARFMPRRDFRGRAFSPEEIDARKEQS